MIFRLCPVYNKHEMKKIDSQIRENRKYYRKCSSNFAADCRSSSFPPATTTKWLCSPPSQQNVPVVWTDFKMKTVLIINSW